MDRIDQERAKQKRVSENLQKLFGKMYEMALRELVLQGKLTVVERDEVLAYLRGRKML